MSICPCCSQKLLHHIGYQRTYWFCSSCWQEMPDSNLVSQANPTNSFRDITQEAPSQAKPIVLKEMPI